MTTIEMIFGLRNIADLHRNDVVDVGELNLTNMCTDVANRLEELYNRVEELEHEISQHN